MGGQAALHLRAGRSGSMACDVRLSQGVQTQDLIGSLAKQGLHVPHFLNSKFNKNDGIWPRNAELLLRIVKVVFLVIQLIRKTHLSGGSFG